MLGREFLLMPFAQIHDGLEVDFVESGQDCRSILGLLHAFRDPAAQPGHFHPLFPAGTAASEESENVALGDTAATARACELARIDLLLLGDPARGRTQPRGLVRLRRLLPGRGSLLLRCFGGLCFTCLGLFSGGSRLFCFHRPLLDHGDHIVAVDRVALLGPQFLYNAVDRCRDFEHDLVGFEIHQVLIAPDGVAGLFVPGRDSRVFHRLGQYGYFYFDRHLMFLVALVARDRRPNPNARANLTGSLPLQGPAVPRHEPCNNRPPEMPNEGVRRT